MLSGLHQMSLDSSGVMSSGFPLDITGHHWTLMAGHPVDTYPGMSSILQDVQSML